MNYCKIFIFITLLSNIYFSYAQLFDDFSDGDFTHNPIWRGDTHLFIVNSDKMLQLSAPDAGNAQLRTAVSVTDSVIEWSFRIKLSFSPSANNYARVYLAVSDTNLSASNLQGYYLQFGENLANDAVELFYKNGATATSIMRGTNGFIALAFDIYVKVLKDTQNHWTLFVHNAQDDIFLKQAESDHPFSNTNYHTLGIYCQYTASNKEKFFFDDFYCGSPRVDNTPPQIIASHILDDHKTAQIHFSETTDSIKTLNRLNYTLLETQQHPDSVTFIANSRRIVQLFYSEKLPEKTTLHLLVSNICDLAGNKMADTICHFLIYSILRHEIIIHEIMAAPHPIVQLPDVEYIELHNRLPIPVNLQNWTLKIGNANRLLPNMTIDSLGYAVLVAQSAYNEFSNRFSCVYPLSSLAITDAGQTLTLCNERNETIHTLTFKKEWHRNPLKRNGGWSLEMIDANSPCMEEENWDSSISELGGTPGYKNSTTAPNPDTKIPQISKITVEDSVTLRLFFSKPILSDSLQLAAAITIDRDMKIAHCKPYSINLKSIKITFSRPLTLGVIYTITIMSGLVDCSGNSVPTYSSIKVGLPQRIENKDIIINEVLSHAFNGENANFVEIYNRSDKILDLRHLQIGNGNGDIPSKTVSAVSDGFLLFPKSYLALCKSPKITMSQYFVPYPDRLVACDSLPSYAHNSGTVHLLDAYFQPIDRFAYDKSMHYALLTSTEGVSLERIHFDAETQNRQNWTSAAAAAGFATPGYTNSQFSELFTANDVFSVVPEVFSPDGDGFDDYAEFCCQFAESGNRVSIAVYDRMGGLIKTIVNNQPCAATECFRWDGDTERGSRATPQLYMVKMEYWNASGKRKNIVKAVGIMLNSR